jgi:hypothetical protein
VIGALLFLSFIVLMLMGVPIGVALGIPHFGDMVDLIGGAPVTISVAR